MVRRRGATLIEVLVVLAIFGLMMLLILGFYLYGVRVSDQRTRHSDRYRRLISVFDKIQVTLEASWVYGITPDGTTIIYCPQEKLELTNSRLAYPSEAHLLNVSQNELVHIFQGEREVLVKLTPEEQLTFAPGKADPNGRLSFIDVNFFVPDPEQPSVKPMVRRLLLEEY